MANIFLQLSSNFKFRKQTLEKITGSADNEEIQTKIDDFYEADEITREMCPSLLISLLPLTTKKQQKDKLLIALVYFLTILPEPQAKKQLQTILNLEQLIPISKVKFLAQMFKTIKSVQIKKWIIIATLKLAIKQDKVSFFTSFIEHFDQLLVGLDLNDSEYIEIYQILISYLQKHPVYKKLRTEYIIKCLLHIKGQKCKESLSSQLIVKVIKNGIVSQNTVALLSHKDLQLNELYPLLEVFLMGNFEQLKADEIQKFKKYELEPEQILKKMKIQAIPKIFASVKSVGYEQVAKSLNIDKSQVEPYIIEAIKQGLLIAKLDQFEETVKIKKINFRVLRTQEQQKLQNDIKEICSRIGNV